MVTRLLETCPVVIEVPLAWGDMDAFQHVNNTVYFRWFESARIAYFEKVGMIDFKEAAGIGPILASTRCRFRIPLAYPDTVSVGTSVSEMAADRFLMKYLVVSQRAEETAAEGDGLVVSFDYRGKRKAPIPAELRRRILELEQQVGNLPAEMT